MLHIWMQAWHLAQVLFEGHLLSMYREQKSKMATIFQDGRHMQK